MAKRGKVISDVLRGLLEGYVGYKQWDRENEPNNLNNMYKQAMIEAMTAKAQKARMPMAPKKPSKSEYDAAYNMNLSTIREGNKASSGGMEITKPMDKALATAMTLKQLEGVADDLQESPVMEEKEEDEEDVDALDINQLIQQAKIWQKGKK